MNEDVIARLKAANADIERRDNELRGELEERRGAASFLPEGIADEEGAGAPDLDAQEFQAETIVLRTGRPVLGIVRNEAQLVFTDTESEVWRERLQQAATHLVNAAQAVGRIEVEGHRLAWVGTGWLVRPDVIVTNRHVADEFGRRTGAGFVFRQGLAGTKMAASIDFLEEIGRTESRTFVLDRILHIEDENGPDVAFLSVRQIAGETLATPIALADSTGDSEMVAVIGYPARDSRIPDQPLMDAIFGNVYDKKRLAPGLITRASRQTIRHDCSTLGGNSGSVVLSLNSGLAVGLHFAGRFLETNFAVAANMVDDRLGRLSRSRSRPSRSPGRAEEDATPQQVAPAGGGGTKVSYVFPVRVSIEVGEPYADGGAARVVPARRVPPDTGAEDEDEIFTEAVPEDYRDREGYQEDFLGDGADVPLPEVTSGKNDVLTFEFDGEAERILRYEHFSVVMSKNRRLCRFSAVNIDGQKSKSLPRPSWRTDPRIPKNAQILKECYGAEPKFSRGHMTRREDPIWGTAASAKRGNTDSMHVTNTVPQMQPFNAGIWLELENYALQNARRDDMKISVITGPFLDPGDPVMFGVKIPIEFWKVIAFIHDETGELSATGYTMSQEDFLREEEFVFGKHKTAQRSIASIEQRTGLSFGPLAELDPFEEEEGISRELTDLRQIQFIRRH